jgi:epoxyqueuosine reductase
LKAEKLKRAVAERALAEGFAVMRVAGADAIPQAPGRLEAWLASGYQGEMGWMEERQRSAPIRASSGARSAPSSCSA